MKMINFFSMASLKRSYLKQLELSASGIQNLFDPAYCAVLQAHLDAMRVTGRFCENILDDAVRQFTAKLILLLDDLHMHPRFNIGSVISIHEYDL